MITSDDLPPGTLNYRFTRARGPGGQHVNKVSSAVELRIDLARAGLPSAVERRLRELAGQRVTVNNEIIFHADEARSQHRNKEAALERWNELLQRAQQRVAKRIATRPSRAAKARRLESKTLRGRTKEMRRKPAID